MSMSTTTTVIGTRSSHTLSLTVEPGPAWQEGVCPRCHGHLVDGAVTVGSPRYRYCVDGCGYDVHGDVPTGLLRVATP